MLRSYRDRSWLDAEQNRQQRTTPAREFTNNRKWNVHSLSEDSPTELRAELKDITCLAALIDTVAKSYI